MVEELEIEVKKIGEKKTRKMFSTRMDAAVLDALADLSKMKGTPKSQVIQSAIGAYLFFYHFTVTGKKERAEEALALLPGIVQERVKRAIEKIERGDENGYKELCEAVAL